MQTNHYQHRVWIAGLLLILSLMLLIPQTVFAWKVEHYEQAQNDDGDGPYAWTTGNLGQIGSTYYENDGVPFRLHLTGLTPGSHTVLLEYKYIKSSKMAYDYLVSWNYTENPDLSFDIPGFPWGGPSTFPIPVDPALTAAGVTPEPGNFAIYNGTITAVSPYTAIPGSGDEDKQLTLTFSTTATEVVIAWAGHVSAEADWGVGNSAVNITGSPYHMKLLAVDGAPTGQRDLQMAASAIVNIELDWGDAPDSYGTTLAANGPNHVITTDLNFGPAIDPEPDGLPTAGADGDDTNATDDEDGISLPALFSLGQQASLSVDGGTLGGKLDAWIDFNRNGVFDHPTELLTGSTIDLNPGVNPIQITVPASASSGASYARFRLSTAGGLTPTGAADDGEVEDYPVVIYEPPGTIIIEKQTLPDGAVETFEFSPSWGSNFSLSDGGTNNSGPLTPGTYSVSEVNIPAGWSLTSATCSDGSDPSAISLQPGETVTCTFTNTQLGTIIIEKQTLPDGSPQSFQFNANVSVQLSDGGQLVSTNLAPGLYFSEEVVPAGWKLTDITIDDPNNNSTSDINSASALISLEPGETVKATYTNTQLGTIIIEKQTLPDGSTETFEFTGDASGVISDGQQITVNSLLPGQYASQELVPAGWDLSDISVNDANSIFDLNNKEVTFNLEAGETVKATFTNTQRGTIIIEKQTDPDGATGSFEFTGDVTGTISDNGQITASNLIPGQYASQELVPSGWDLTSIVLDDDNSTEDVNTASVNFVLDPGETVKAVFTNTLNVTEIDVEKNANVNWERTYEWDIEKSVQPAAWHLFNGETGESEYTVKVTRSVTSDMITVSGQVCVTNTGQIATSGLMYIDSLQYRTPQMTDWAEIETSTGTPAAIPAGQTGCYNYEFTFEAIPDAEYRNVAVARITNFAGHEGMLYGPRFVIPVNLPQVPNQENNPLVNVEDSNGMQWEFTDSDSVKYNQTFSCAQHEGSNGNTATITQTGQQASATVMVYCYEVDIEKTAETSFNRQYQWTIDKNADEETLGLHSCTTDTVAYTVMVDTTGYQDTDFLVQGTITIHNPAPKPAQINSLEDLLDGQPVQLECQIQLPLIIAPEDSFTCGYQKVLPGNTQLVNTATAVQQLFDYPPSGEPSSAETTPHQAMADVIFGAPSNEIDECVTVTDTNVDPTTLGTVCAADGPKTFEYDLVVGPYTGGGLHQVDNTATFTTNDTETEGSDNWTISVTVTCASEVMPNFEADIVDGASPLTVQFTDLSLNAAGWLWDFGDGTTSTEQNPVHVFHNPAMKYYTVRLTVWDCCEELSDTRVLENYIRVSRAAEVKFNASPLVVAPNEDVQFTNLCGGSVNWFEWNFGDGQVLKVRHTVTDKINPTHAYAEEGAYTVSLRAYGEGGDSTATVKDMIYVNPNFVNMKFVDGSQTLPYEPWVNAIDHDIITTNSSVVADNNDAWAVFSLVDDASPILFDKVRILSNNGMGNRYANHLIKEFELWVSMDNITYELAMSGSLNRHDMWRTFEFSPKAGKYVKLMVKSAQGAGSPYVALGELQLFGTSPAALALLKDVDGLDIVDWAPVTEFQLKNAYPNPFNPSTTIQFALPTDAIVQLDVFNIRGQLVRTILNREVPSGRYSYLFDAGGLNSGIYFYRFTAGKYQEIKRMTFLK